MNFKRLRNRILDSWGRNVVIPILAPTVDIIASLFNKKKKDYTPQTLLIMRFDAIGDYVLFRNFVEVIRKSDKYKGYHVTLCGNIIWKPLAETFDKDWADAFIWIDFGKVFNDFSYRYQKVKELSQSGYEVLISSTSARNFYKEDMFVRIINAKEKIGCQSRVWENMSASQKRKADKYYNKLIPVSNHNEFEFYLNQNFVCQLLDTKEIPLKKTHFEVANDKLKYALPDKYAIIAPGAGAKFRRWDMANFAKIADYLYQKYQLSSVIVGSKGDKELAKRIIENSSHKDIFTDLTGISTLTELVILIKKASIVVANESSGTHIAVAVDTPVVCISNGNHFGRFNPYPFEIATQCITVYPPEITEKLDRKEELISLYASGSKLNINTITPDEVIKSIDKLL